MSSGIKSGVEFLDYCGKRSAVLLAVQGKRRNSRSSGRSVVSVSVVLSALPFRPRCPPLLPAALLPFRLNKSGNPTLAVPSLRFFVAVPVFSPAYCWSVTSSRQPRIRPSTSPSYEDERELSRLSCDDCCANAGVDFRVGELPIRRRRDDFPEALVCAVWNAAAVGLSKAGEGEGSASSGVERRAGIERDWRSELR